MAKAAKAQKVVEPEVPQKVKRTKKDKDAPKRALSAYMFFSQDNRDKVRNDHPEASFGEVGRLLGARWKEMSEAQKQPYKDMAERDKVRATNEKSAYKTAAKASKGRK